MQRLVLLFLPLLFMTQTTQTMSASSTSHTVVDRHTIVEIDNLSWSYPHTDQMIFEHLSLALHTGELCVVMGRSGVGKTTLTKLLLRELKPPLGTIYYQKTDLARLRTGEVQRYRQNVGVVFQDNKLLDWKTVFDNIAYPLRIRGVGDSDIKERVEELLTYFGLTEKRDVRIPFLSGGEKQKVATARAIIHKPEFIIADEPTGNLDDQSSQQLVDQLIRLHHDGHSLVFITHDAAIVDYLSRHTTIRKIVL